MAEARATRIAVLGAGPAAATTAMLLQRAGHGVRLIGRARRQDAIEGLSWRVLDGLGLAGFAPLAGIAGERWRRLSVWGGEMSAANGEHVVRRKRFDRFLLERLQETGIAVIDAEVDALLPGGETERLVYRPAGDARRREMADFDFIVDARGPGAPKAGRNEAEAPLSLALACTFENAIVTGEDRTYNEPFRHGWAWASHGRRGEGHVQIVVEPVTVKAERSGLAAGFRRLFSQLPFIAGRLGPGVRFGSRLEVRGIHPVLRGERVSPRHIRVGDACYSGDPLSGHGIFEAVAGAHAAIPVINTLLERPGSRQLAMRYYDERSRRIFGARMQAAGHFYRSEPRWQEAPFWRHRTQLAGLAPEAPPGTAAAFVLEPVVEDGYIVERRVAMLPGERRGVRFIDGVDLARLGDALAESGAGVAPEQLCERLRLPRQALVNAWTWLFRHALVDTLPASWRGSIAR